VMTASPVSDTVRFVTHRPGRLAGIPATTVPKRPVLADAQQAASAGFLDRKLVVDQPWLLSLRRFLHRCMAVICGFCLAAGADLCPRRGP
jgi:hypothetical protein